MSRALVTGCTGQDGSYLCELLLEKGYEVHGIIRRSSSFNTGRIDHIFDKLNLHYGDMSDGSSLTRILYDYWPDEIYHLAAQSHVQVSFEMPEYTTIADGLSTLKLLEAIKLRVDGHDNYRYPVIYNACTSEMFGSSPPPQNENTPFQPCSPYGTAKLFSYWTARNYRDAYGIPISNGILFNHESPRRGETFITRKVCKAAVRIAAGLQSMLIVGNLTARRDWGHAKDHVNAMYLINQHAKTFGGQDFVIANESSYTVRYLIEYAFEKAGMNLTWSKDDVGMVNDKPVVYTQRSRYVRPNEVNSLEGNANKAKNILGWKPKYNFHDLIDEMVQYEKDQLK